MSFYVMSHHDGSKVFILIMLSYYILKKKKKLIMLSFLAVENLFNTEWPVNSF